ncbi:kelch-like protein 11 [Mastacembelus armatus]|uniref:Kelch-like family member 11 n=1 Tax=Mastacembelus armatus TaxID=205130 RepID=A0A3Q3MM72_9TELE|nr:kelch-like protein 11 [Mastacembelus armatus]
MSVFECLFTCVIYASEFLPKIGQSRHLPLRRASSCGMAAAAAAEGPDDCSRSGAVLTGDGEPEEAEEFTCSAYCSELSRRQNQQRKAGLFCDLTLVFSSRGLSGERVQTVSAHRSVLSAASHYFTLLLGGQFSESLSGRVELKQWSSENGPNPDTVESVIEFMYTGEIRVTTANVHEVLELADRFLLVQLKNFCGEFLVNKLSFSNCVAVHSLAHMYTLDQLALEAAEMIRRNFHKIINNEEFYMLPFHLLRDWMSDSEIIVDSEQELFEAILKWVHKNTEEREMHFEKLFRLLRLPQIAPIYLTRVVRKDPLVASSAACQQLVSDALEVHAVHFESLKSADLQLCASFLAPIQPRFGQNMDVIMVVGGVSEGGEYLSECVGYFIAEDRWVNLPHIHNHLDGHAIAVTDSHVYVAGSMEPGFAKVVERYNPKLNSWEQVSSLTARKHSFGLACVKDVLYSIGGHGNFSPGFKDVNVYKPEQDQWHNLEPAPKILRDVKTVSVEDRYLYVMARTPVDMDNEDGLSTVTTCYDTETQKWQEVNMLPLVDNYCSFQMAVASMNFYHTASCCPKSYKVTFEAAQQKIRRNISEDILDSLPPEVLSMEGAAVCYLGEDVFIIGGWRNSNNVDKQYRREAYRYCAERKRWMLLPPLPQPRCRATACHVRIPYQYLYGSQRYPMPQNLARQRDRMQQMQQLHRRTLTLRRQLHSQIEC